MALDRNRYHKDTEGIICQAEKKSHARLDGRDGSLCSGKAVLTASSAREK
jgi:hypothetical protein